MLKNSFRNSFSKFEIKSTGHLKPKRFMFALYRDLFFDLSKKTSFEKVIYFNRAGGNIMGFIWHVEVIRIKASI